MQNFDFLSGMDSLSTNDIFVFPFLIFFDPATWMNSQGLRECQRLQQWDGLPWQVGTPSLDGDDGDDGDEYGDGNDDDEGRRKMMLMTPRPAPPSLDRWKTTPWRFDSLQEPQNAISPQIGRRCCNNGNKDCLMRIKFWNALFLPLYHLCIAFLVCIYMDIQLPTQGSGDRWLLPERSRRGGLHHFLRHRQSPMCGGWWRWVPAS